MLNASTRRRARLGGGRTQTVPEAGALPLAVLAPAVVVWAG